MCVRTKSYLNIRPLKLEIISIPILKLKVSLTGNCFNR